MSPLLTFLAWLSTGTNGFMFAASASAFAFMLMISLFLINTIRKLDLSQLFYETKAKDVSSTKFWHVVACFVATIAFLFINFAAPASASLEFIWLTYLGVIAGSASVSKLITAKYAPSPTPVMSSASMYPQPMDYGMQEPQPAYQPVMSCRPEPN